MVQLPAFEKANYKLLTYFYFFVNTIYIATIVQSVTWIDGFVFIKFNVHDLSLLWSTQ